MDERCKKNCKIAYFSQNYAHHYWLTSRDLPVNSVLITFVDVGTHDVVRGGDVIALVVVHGVTVHVGGGVACEGLVEGSVCRRPMRIVHPSNALHRAVMRQTVIVLKKITATN